MDLLHETLRLWAMRREFRAVIAELKGYTDRDLVELGLQRADIARVAWEEAERRIATPAATSRNPEPGDPLIASGSARLFGG